MRKNQKKISALATHLKLDTTDIDNDGDEGVLFESSLEEYLVLTESEANERVKEAILESLWAFNHSFLCSHSDAIAAMTEDSFKVLQEQCESINPAIKAMIDDLDHFIKDAILSDGRGHFLSPYDGEENEEKIGNEWFYIYRIN